MFIDFSITALHFHSIFLLTCLCLCFIRDFSEVFFDLQTMLFHPDMSECAIVSIHFSGRKILSGSLSNLVRWHDPFTHISFSQVCLRLLTVLKAWMIALV